MLRLGVNIDHAATLRQARGTDYPDILEVARLCETAGAHGITVHLREDRRHIQDSDVYALKKSLKIRLNLEMANIPEIVAVALDVHPDEVCIVPEKREELTTEGGLDVVGHMSELAGTIKALSDARIIVSLFIDPETDQIKAAAELGVPCIELHTGTYCNADNKEAELAHLISGAIYAHELGIKVNAGHGINLGNIKNILNIPHIDTLNIGHSIVSRSIFVGMEQAVREMMKKMEEYPISNKE
ncbi:pyridoxine 5'-phosphate synthase [Verrucomicrobiota bacterium]